MMMRGSMAMIGVLALGLFGSQATAFPTNNAGLEAAVPNIHINAYVRVGRGGFVARGPRGGVAVGRYEGSQSEAIRALIGVATTEVAIMVAIGLGLACRCCCGWGSGRWSRSRCSSRLLPSGLLRLNTKLHLLRQRIVDGHLPRSKRRVWLGSTRSA